MDFGITSIRNSLQTLDKAASTVKNTVNIGTNILDTIQDPVGALSNLGSKYSTENLAFPRDVENPDVGVGNHGHYILFSINTQERAKLRTSPIGSGGSRVDDITRDANIPEYLKQWDSVSGTYKAVANANAEAKQLNDSVKKLENNIAKTGGGGSNPFIDMKEGRTGGRTPLDNRY